MKITIKNTEQHLRKHKIMPSVQRIRIYETLLDTTEHPTVDTIYQSLAKEIPTLSKTTVYNTLKLFQEKGLVLVVNIEDNETRYDADTSFTGILNARHVDLLLILHLMKKIKSAH